GSFIFHPFALGLHAGLVFSAAYSPFSSLVLDNLVFPSALPSVSAAGKPHYCPCGREGGGDRGDHGGRVFQRQAASGIHFHVPVECACEPQPHRWDGSVPEVSSRKISGGLASEVLHGKRKDHHSPGPWSRRTDDEADCRSPCPADSLLCETRR